MSDILAERIAGGQPKYALIKESVKRKILAGNFESSGNRLPTCRDLAEIYGASYLTVNKAMKALQDEGYTKSVQGKGIFAVTRSPKKERRTSQNLRKSVGFIMPTEGDLYQSIFTGIFKGLEAHGILSTPLTDTSMLDAMNVSAREEKFDKFTSDGFKAFVIAGNRHFQFKLFQKFYERVNQTVFVSHFEGGFEFPGANYILSDYRKGGFLAADCLLKNLRRKIGLLTYHQLKDSEINQYGCSARHHDSDLADGIKEAFAANSLDPRENFHVFRKQHVTGNLEPEVIEFIESGGDGLICFGDNKALAVYRHLISRGQKAGKEVGVVGYYNTSWAEVFNPPLASVSINEQQIAELAVQAIVNNWKGRRMVVPPKLILRGSI